MTIRTVSGSGSEGSKWVFSRLRPTTFHCPVPHRPQNSFEQNQRHPNVQSFSGWISFLQSRNRLRRVEIWLTIGLLLATGSGGWDWLIRWPWFWLHEPTVCVCVLLAAWFLGCVAGCSLWGFCSSEAIIAKTLQQLSAWKDTWRRDRVRFIVSFTGCQQGDAC